MRGDSVTARWAEGAAAILEKQVFEIKTYWAWLSQLQVSKVIKSGEQLILSNQDCSQGTAIKPRQASAVSVKNHSRSPCWNEAEMDEWRMVDS
jgi:hypothetical protein